MKQTQIVTDTIYSVVHKSPGWFGRWGIVFVLGMFLGGIWILTKTVIAHQLLIPGRVLLMTENMDRTVQLTLGVESKNIKIQITDPTAIVTVKGRRSGIAEISLNGHIDSIQYEKGLVYFSYSDPEMVQKLIKQNMSVSIQINKVETTYFNIFKYRF